MDHQKPKDALTSPDKTNSLTLSQGSETITVHSAQFSGFVSIKSIKHAKCQLRLELH